MKKQLTGWRRRIAEAKTRGWFTGDDVRDSLRWTTCAIGEARTVFPRRINITPLSIWGPCGSPRDGKWLLVGEAFFMAVSDGNFGEALRVLKRIEAGR